MDDKRVELTLRGLLIGAAITLVFTAANVYAGLKVGLTFATTIPAAVISMGVLRAFRNSTIWENNIVQTVASAAGTLSAIIFVLPGLVMIGAWTGFPFWQSFGICAVGGVLGVMYSVPLRRALVAQSDLPYPEGVAAAEVLKVGSGGVAPGEVEHNRAGMLALVVASAASFGLAAFAGARIVAGQVAAYVKAGPADTGLAFGLSMLLVGAGHLIGLSVGLAMLAGLVIAWGFLTPILSALHPMAGDAATVALGIWQSKVRFVGAGTIAIAALWTLGRLARPVWSGLVSAVAASRHRSAHGSASLPIVERDIPIGIVGAISALCLVPLAVLLVTFLAGGVEASAALPLALVALAYIVVVGFLVAAACGYMAGLIGSSNSPVSGLAILAALGISVVLVAMVGRVSAVDTTALIAYALFVTAVVLAIATISNDNLQDLKTGQLVGATPWKQQAALIVGVVFGAAIIPPVLDLLNHAYGFSGSAHALPAPQATLIAALAKGVIAGKSDWGLLGAGALIGAGLIAIDELLRRGGRQLPPLAVGLGIYLPASTIAAVVLGAVLGWFYNRWAERQQNPERAKQLGVLSASGMIVGESLFGVAFAALVVVLKNDNPLGDGGALAGFATPIGVAGFVALVAGLYLWTARLARKSSAGTRSGGA